MFYDSRVSVPYIYIWSVPLRCVPILAFSNSCAALGGAQSNF